MKGTIYGIGLGPGDPELVTLKAVRLIRSCEVLAAPGRDPRKSIAFRIAAGAVPEAEEKEILPLDMPMTTDEEELRAAHERSVACLREQLDVGKSIAYLTLGDPTVYCTFSYLAQRLQAEGYEAQYVSGVTSFCAAAARLGMPLVEWDEPLHILPASHRLGDALEPPGTYVLMKSASRIREVREMLGRSGRRVSCVINCGMEDERICRSLEEIPEDAGYFSLIVAKEMDE